MSIDIKWMTMTMTMTMTMNDDDEDEDDKVQFTIVIEFVQFILLYTILNKFGYSSRTYFFS